MVESDLKSRAIRGVIFNWIGRGCSIGITFFLTPYLVHTLGDERYGLWSIVMSFVGYYAMADLGLRGTNTKYIAQYYALRDYDRIGKIIVTSLFLYGGIALVFLPFVAGLSVVFPYLVDTSGESDFSMQVVVFIIGITFVFRLISQPFGATLTALARFDISNLVSVVSQLVGAVTVVSVLAFGGGLVGMAVGTLVVGVLTQVTNFVFAKRLLQHVRLSISSFDRGLVRDLFSFSLALFLINGARRLAQYTAILLIGIVLGPAIVTVYSLADSVVSKAMMFTGSITRVVTPVASQQSAVGKRESLVAMATVAARVLQACALSFLVVCITFGQDLIEMWLGNGYGARVYPLLCILAVANYVSFIAGAIPSMLIGMGEVRALTKIVCVDACLAVGLGGVLMKFHGVTGMAIGILGARSLTYGIAIPFLGCRVLNQGWFKFVITSVGPAILASIPMAVVAVSLSVICPPTTLLGLIGEVACIGMCLVFGIIAFVLPQELRASIVHALMVKKASGVSEMPSPTDK